MARLGGCFGLVVTALPLWLAACGGKGTQTPYQGPNLPEPPDVPATPMDPNRPPPQLPPQSPPVASACQPEKTFVGNPIAATPGQWTWVPFPDALCRDGTTTGIGVRLREGSNKVAIYFEGGAACFHEQSCQVNAFFQHFDADSFKGWIGLSGNGGVFDLSKAENPFRDYSMIYVPYCTGDVHAGNREHVDVPGNAPKDQMFVGFRNVERYLQRLVPTFPKATDVVITGVSAGGFGAALNYDHIAQAFCHSRNTLVDDSGPPMSDQYMTPCLQKRWRELWNMDVAIPDDCVGCSNADGGGLVNYFPYLVKKYPKSVLSLISSDEDGIISTFYGYGMNDCQGLEGRSAGMSGPTYAAGLAEFRNNDLAGSPYIGSYILHSTSHTWLTGLSFYNTTVSGMALTEWVNLIINEGIATHIDP